MFDDFFTVGVTKMLHVEEIRNWQQIPTQTLNKKYLDKDVSCFSKSQILFTVFHKT